MASEKVLESGIMGKYSVWYAFEVSNSEKNTLIIDEKGEVQARVEQAQKGSSPRELGWFHLSLGHSDPDLVAIAKIIQEKELIGGEAISRLPARGRRYRTFNFKRNGEETHHRIFAEERVPEPLAGVMVVISRLFNRLEKAPLQTLAMEISFEPAQIKPGDDLRVVLEFRTAGKFPTEFRNPASFSSSGAGSLRMNLWKRVRGKNEELSYDFVTTLDLGGREFLLNGRKAVPSNKPLLRIAPGGSLRMITKIRFPKVDPDNYSVEAIYFAGPDPENQELNPDLIVGTYHTDAKEIVVLKK